MEGTKTIKCECGCSLIEFEFDYDCLITYVTHYKRVSSGLPTLERVAGIAPPPR